MMYALRNQKILGLLYVELPPFVGSLLIAELFFKFKSFTLEALAFLAAWYGLSVLYTQGLTVFSQWTTRIPSPERVWSGTRIDRNVIHS
jgi:hypothetical protein